MAKAPSYDSSNYDAAAQKYKELQSKYSGEQGWNLAQSQATTSANQAATQAGQTAGAQAAGAARAAGMSRAKAAMTGASIAGNTTANSYGGLYNSALSAANANNKSAIDAQNALMAGEQQKDTNKYNSKAAEWSATTGAIGGALSGLAKVSDKNKKKVTDCTSSDRCDELLKKLRG